MASRMYPKHTADDHLRKMKHDQNVALELAKKDDCCDWTIICAFYFAIHCVEAYAHKHGIERELVGDLGDEESLHKKRERFVRNHVGEFFTLYLRLYDKSRQARYDPTYFEKIYQLKGYHQKLLQATQKLESIL